MAQPIGVMDSGVGGISVLKELVKIMPQEDFIYFGDSKNAPYGTKTLEEVRGLVFDVTDDLLARGAKGLVVACNTATSAAVRKLRETYPDLPIVGIEPAVKPAVSFMEHPRVLVMATPMTVREEKLHLLIDRYKEEADIIPLACPELMNYVERGQLNEPDSYRYLGELLAEYKETPVDAVVLGCTHYPFIKGTIQRALGYQVTIFDGGEGTAREMRRRLAEAGLLEDEGRKGSVTFDNSLEGQEKEGKIALCKYLMET